MAADFNKPVMTDNYVDLLAMLRDNQEVLARMFASGTAASNIPVGSVKFDSGKFQTWNGSAWDDVPVSIDGGGTGAQSAADARVALGANNAANLTIGVMSADRVPGLDASKIISGTLTRDTSGNAATATYATSAGSAATASAAPWTGLTGKPAVIGAGTTALEAREAIGAVIGKTVSVSTSVGIDVLPSSTADYNTGVGYRSLYNSTGGSTNSALGYESLYRNTSGSANTAIGCSAMYSNTTGNGNTGVGYASLFNNASYSNCSALGNGSGVTGSNQVQLGDSATTTYVYGTVQNRSDERDKTDIRDTTLGLDFIKQLRPVDYRWDMREDYRPKMPDQKPNESDEQFKTRIAAWLETSKLSNIQRDGSKKRSRYHHGLIAQEVKKTIDEIGVDFGGFQHHLLSGGDDVMSIGYDELIAPLIKAVQELSEEVERLKAQNR